MLLPGATVWSFAARLPPTFMPSLWVTSYDSSDACRPARRDVENAGNCCVEMTTCVGFAGTGLETVKSWLLLLIAIVAVQVGHWLGGMLFAQLYFTELTDGAFDAGS